MFKRIALGMIALMVVLMAVSMSAMAEDKIIKIDGSSTVYPITEAVAEEFQNAQRGSIRVTAGISGTGGGFKNSAVERQTSRMHQGPFSKKKWTCAKSKALNI